MCVFCFVLTHEIQQFISTHREQEKQTKKNKLKSYLLQKEDIGDADFVSVSRNG